MNYDNSRDLKPGKKILLKSIYYSIKKMNPPHTIPRQRRFFLNMMEKKAIQIAKPFLREERSIVKNILNSKLQGIAKTSLIAIGDGIGFYIDFFNLYCSQYIVIDPLLDQHKMGKTLHPIDPNIIWTPKAFREVSLNRRSQEAYLFLFFFNVAAYMPLEELVETVNKNSKNGDKIILSTWSKNKAAQNLKNQYFSLVHQPGESETALEMDFATIPVTHFNYYKQHEIFYGSFADIMVIFL